MMVRPRPQALKQDALSTPLLQPLPRRLEVPTVDCALTAFGRRVAALRVSLSRNFPMNDSAPDPTGRHHLPTF